MYATVAHGFWAFLLPEIGYAILYSPNYALIADLDSFWEHYA